MTAKERRQAIIEILCQRRKETRANLAAEFGVTMRTIEYDIVELSLQYPIYTKQGSDGGIFVVDGFDLGRKYLPKSQTDFLESLLDRLCRLAVCGYLFLCCDFAIVDDYFPIIGKSYHGFIAFHQDLHLFLLLIHTTYQFIGAVPDLFHLFPSFFISLYKYAHSCLFSCLI